MAERPPPKARLIKAAIVPAMMRWNISQVGCPSDLMSNRAGIFAHDDDRNDPAEDPAEYLRKITSG
jgi:hypothetical protein